MARLPHIVVIAAAAAAGLPGAAEERAGRGICHDPELALYARRNLGGFPRRSFKKNARKAAAVTARRNHRCR